MAVSYVGVGAQGASNTNGAVVTYNWPAGYTPVVGDLALVFQTGWWTQPSSSNPPDGPAPSGYTFVNKHSRDASATLCVASSFYQRFLDGTESAPTVTLTSTYASATNVTNGFVVIIRQAHNSSTYDGGAVKYSSGAATTLTVATFSSTVNDTITVSGVGQGGAGAIARGTGGTGASWIYRATGANYDTTLGSDSAAGLATRVLATAGALGFHDWQSTVSAGWAGLGLRITSATVPTTGATPTVKSTGVSSAELYWSTPFSGDGGQTIVNYSVQYSTDNTNWSAGTLTTAGTAAASNPTFASPYVLTGLSPGTLYYFRVAAVNSVGTGAYSTGTVSAETSAIGSPGILNLI